MAPEKGHLSESTRKMLEGIASGSIQEVRQALAEKGAQVDAHDEHGMTPLQHAAYKGNRDICELLLAHGADVNTDTHEHGYSALMFAALSGKTEVTRLILEAGARTSHQNNIGRTASQMAAFVGQHQCVSLINNFFSKDELDYYTQPHDLQKEARLPLHLSAPLYKFILHSNLNPVRLSMYLNQHAGLLEESEKVYKLLEHLCEKMMKQSDTNEVMGIKFHYLSRLVKTANQSRKDKGDSNLDTWIKSLVKGRASDGFPETQERFIRSTFKDFPYIECQLLQQLVRNLAPVKIGDDPTALMILTQGINGQRFLSDEEPSCDTCGDRQAPKKCSACKKVNYCNQECQKLHWSTHKKFCKKLAEVYKLEQEEKRRMDEEEKKKEEEERLRKEEEERRKQEANEDAKIVDQMSTDGSTEDKGAVKTDTVVPPGGDTRDDMKEKTETEAAMHSTSTDDVSAMSNES